ncbi:hypothetical protein M9H77_06944 [Catharanthus roseus]|uniref:Uncharacterized protein n=1 Tax=Catharanthus roseus TaxID=4058 RepID=A0ACC0BTJ3_CATRO|nr:hypothetical protein M9H77_06944 [Catharanthus roseus]
MEPLIVEEAPKVKELPHAPIEAKERLVERSYNFDSISIISKENEHFKCSEEKESELEKSERVKENECFIEKKVYLKYHYPFKEKRFQIENEYQRSTKTFQISIVQEKKTKRSKNGRLRRLETTSVEGRRPTAAGRSLFQTKLKKTPTVDGRVRPIVAGRSLFKRKPSEQHLPQMVVRTYRRRARSSSKDTN